MSVSCLFIIPYFLLLLWMECGLLFVHGWVVDTYGWLACFFCPCLVMQFVLCSKALADWTNWGKSRIIMNHEHA